MRTIEWEDGVVVTIDQTKLPHELALLKMKTCEEVAEAIKSMKVRGAPLIGVTAAYGLALTAYHSTARNKQDLLQELKESAETLRRTRPTAVNLSWAIDRVLRKAEEAAEDVKLVAKAVMDEAVRMADEDVEVNRRIGRIGAELINDGDVVLTHCNAGSLATVGYGTALGVIRAAVGQGKRVRVFVTETRPKLQGAKLTAYELKRDGIPVTLITDNAVGYVMYKRMINKVIVGADRIVKDAVINKVGTYEIAALAHENEVPFYVAAPTSSFDLTRTAEDVIIEERSPEEVTYIGSVHVAPEGVDVFNPAFDITPFQYVDAIICEGGILFKPNYEAVLSVYKGR